MIIKRHISPNRTKRIKKVVHFFVPEIDKFSDECQMYQEEICLPPEQDEFLKNIESYLLELTERQRQVIRLRFLSGCQPSFYKIAPIMGVDVSTVHWHYVEAIKRLKAIVATRRSFFKIPGEKLEKLTPRQLEIINLRFSKDGHKSLQEIASILGSNVATVRRHFLAALKKLDLLCKNT